MSSPNEERLGQLAQPTLIKFAGKLCVVNKLTRMLNIDGQPISLPPREYSFLELLTDNLGTLVERDYIIERFRAENHVVTSRNLDVIVNRLRNHFNRGYPHMGDPGSGVLHTIQNRGYIMHYQWPYDIYPQGSENL